MKRLLTAAVLLLCVVAGVTLYAWLAGDEMQSPDDGMASGADPVNWETGFAVYQTNCMACHGGEGQGRAGHFPPLVGHVPEMLGREGGRAYLLDVMLNGVAGETKIDGVRYDGFMPPFRQLSDEELADLMNYLAHAWGNENALPTDHEPFTPAEVAERRWHERPPREVGAAQPR